MSRPTPDSILALARGWSEARVLLTGAELDLFTVLARGPARAAAVAQTLGGDLRAITIILDALTAMDLLEKREGVYSCAPGVADLLASDSPTTVLPMVLHTATLWRRWSRLTEIACPQRAVPDPDAQTRAFIGAMHVVSGPKARATVEVIEPGPARALLDIGGGSGTYTIAFLEASSAMRATLFDLPDVIPLAHDRLAEAGLLDRVALVAGDYNTDDLPPGHDLALLSAIIHQNSSDRNAALYQRIFAALDPGGRLVIRDFIMAPDHVFPPAGAMFAVNMLSGTDGGTYTFEETRGLLVAAGFERVRILANDNTMDGLIEAYRP